MDTLQIGFIVAGIAAIVGIIAFNKWQESLNRRRAGKAFPDNLRDPLLEPLTDNEPTQAPREPVIGQPAAEEDSPPIALPEHKKPSLPTYRQPPRQRPPLPDRLDSRLDCCIRIEAVEPIEVPRFWAAQTEMLDDISRPVRWYAFDDRENKWRRVDGHAVGSHHWFLAALQLVDREGTVTDGDFSRYTRGMQRLADQFSAVPSGMPSRVEVLSNAKALDRFCAEVDVQVAINVISQKPMQGSKISALAEAEGLRLEGDGVFHARAADSRTLYTLGNGEEAPFDRNTLAKLQTKHLCLLLDVPRVADASSEFEDMMKFATHLAQALGAAVVDDNWRPFGQESVDTIRSRVRRYQTRMSEEGIPPGGSLARRLFSA